jgi:hypothetical protein
MITLMMLHRILVKLPKIQAQMMHIWMPNIFHLALIPMLILLARKIPLAAAVNLPRLPRTPLAANRPRPSRPRLAIRKVPRRRLLREWPTELGPPSRHTPAPARPWRNRAGALLGPASNHLLMITMWTWDPPLIPMRILSPLLHTLDLLWFLQLQPHLLRLHIEPDFSKV